MFLRLSLVSINSVPLSKILDIPSKKICHNFEKATRNTARNARFFLQNYWNLIKAFIVGYLEKYKLC